MKRATQRPSLACALALSCFIWGAWPAKALAQVPKPSEIFGFEPGEDYKLADYDQLLDYYRRLAGSSDRVRLREIGRSVLGKPMLLLSISSRENLSRLERWKQISGELARARIDAETAESYAREGKAVVWIDAGLHATERAPAQMMPLLAYRMATEESREMRRIRDNVILLLMPVMNPDGLQIVVDWYRKNRGTPFETTRPPWLYHHYIGHDNNRDWFMNNMPETQAVSEVVYSEWFPQIVYNHHQTGPSWARIFLPPFADPVNPNIHPGVTTAVNIVGSAMANRFAMKGMPGVVSDMIYSMWWDGGMRTVPYFHNMIGILTETSHATPTPRRYDPDKRPKFIGSPRRGQGAPTDGTDIFYPFPWQGGESHFRDAVDYTLVASMAVLDVAAKLKEKWLYDFYSMGRDAIERGRKEALSYVVPAQQWDDGEAVNLINLLRLGGVEVDQARAAFQAGGRQFLAGSYVISGAQAFLPYVKDLLEKQVYPDRRKTPDGPPDPPYDLAGWTLPLQMGVEVVPLESAFDVSLGPVKERISIRPGRVAGEAGFGYLLSHRPNAQAKAVNRLLREGERVYWLLDSSTTGGHEYEAGTILVVSGEGTRERLESVASELGVDFQAVAAKPQGHMTLLKPTRVGLYKSWVANIDEGWTRWLLEKYEFDFANLSDQDVRQGDLSRFNAIILPSQASERILNGHPAGTMPEEYVGGLGLEGALALQRFAESGGTILALDQAADFAIEQFGLPLRDVTRGLSPRRFFIPGSLVRAEVNNSNPLAFGMQKEVAASFLRSRAFEPVKLSRRGEGGQENTAPAPPSPVDTVATYAADNLLMSGWALGARETIGGKAAMASVPLGRGEVILYGFRPQFRGQPRGTYKLLFNALHRAASQEAE
ncbi:MAG: M14 metallopeptidase family protein [Acidobacteriota bacterium]